MAARSVYTLSRWKRWQYVVKSWLPGSLVGLLGVGAVIGACWIIPSRQAADIRGATTCHGSGVVTSFTYGIVDQSGHRSLDQINIALNGTEAIYSGTKFLLLQQGQRVEVTYRTGKSGNVYVADITPEGAAKP